MFTRFEHLILTSRLAFYISKRLGADPETCTRAAMLHDVEAKYYDTKGAREHARVMGESEEVSQAVYTHMLNKKPRTREAWVVVLADQFSTYIEMLSFLRHYLRKFIATIWSYVPFGGK